MWRFKWLDAIFDGWKAKHNVQVTMAFVVKIADWFCLFSSGTPGSNGNNLECLGEFTSKIQKAKSEISENKIEFIFTKPSSSKVIELGNWRLTSPETGTLVITNREGSRQKLVVRDAHPGFLFESSVHQKITFTAESFLGCPNFNWVLHRLWFFKAQNFPL